MISMTWLYGFLGGLLIGTAGLLFLLINGKIMGVSGIVGGILQRSTKIVRLEGVAFLVGLILTPFILSFFIRLPETNASHSLWLLVIAGVLVGLGTRMGSGCTSGHGVCGIARFSRRSIIATGIFMSVGIFTVLLIRLLGVSL